MCSLSDVSGRCAHVDLVRNLNVLVFKRHIIQQFSHDVRYRLMHACILIIQPKMNCGPIQYVVDQYVGFVIGNYYW